MFMFIKPGLFFRIFLEKIIFSNKKEKIIKIFCGIAVSERDIALFKGAVSERDIALFRGGSHIDFLTHFVIMAPLTCPLTLHPPLSPATWGPRF